MKQRALVRIAKALNSVYAPSWAYGGPWYQGVVLESETGAWQTNTVVYPSATLLSFSAVFACVTGIASDVAKMRVKLSRNNEGIWEEITEGPATWLKILREPNHFQDWFQFMESWMLSKLLYGNTYVLKKRETRRGLVNALYVLHPNCVKPLVADNGDVYYQLSRDDLSKVFDIESVSDEQPVVPASEIIHDRFNTLWHQLIGVSPLYACGQSATMGSAIQANATKFFQNLSRPGGMLSSPHEITNETAERLKAYFESSFSGDNIGKMLVAGDGLKYEVFGIDAQKSQQVEQLDEAVKHVARAFHYPLWKLGGPNSPYTKPDQAETAYYSGCLQPHIVQIESCLDKGLELTPNTHTEFDLEDLMRMDRNALFEMLRNGSDFLKLDEQRFTANYPPLPIGGNTVYKQEQNYSVEALAKRDARPDPFASTSTQQGNTPDMATPSEPEDMPVEMDEENMKAMFKLFESDLEARALASR